MQDTSSPAQTPYVVIRATTGWRALNLREVWQFRDLLLSLGGRDVRVRYKQTALGVVWIVLQPLIAAGLLSFVFGNVAGLKAPGPVPNFLFVFTGFVGWTVFSKTLTRAASSMVGNQQLVSKVYFPRLVLPLSSVLSTLVDFAIALSMLAVLLGLYWHLPGVNVLMMPVCLGFMMMLAMGLGLCATAIAVSYRDVDYLIPVFTQFLMYGSPVAYDVSKVVEKVEQGRIPEWVLQLYYMNPMVALLEGFRWSVLGVGQVHPGYLAYSAAASLFVFLLGAYAFKRMEKSFADVI